MNSNTISDTIALPKKRGEMTFRLMASTVTCLLYLIVQIVIVVLLVVLFTSVFKGITQTNCLEALFFWISLIILIANLLGWILVSTMPLLAKASTYGMRLFGLRLVMSNGKELSTKAIVLREVILLVLGFTGFGLIIGCIFAAINKEDLAWWDTLSSTEIIQVPARIQYVNEVRERVAGQG